MCVKLCIFLITMSAACKYVLGRELQEFVYWHKVVPLEQAFAYIRSASGNGEGTALCSRGK